MGLPEIQGHKPSHRWLWFFDPHEFKSFLKGPTKFISSGNRNIRIHRLHFHFSKDLVDKAPEFHWALLSYKISLPTNRGTSFQFFKGLNMSEGRILYINDVHKVLTVTHDFKLPLFPFLNHSREKMGVPWAPDKVRTDGTS